ncbi:ATP-binding protein [Paenibacillus sp. MER 78]|uniref:histidine kinase n=1 Tax=Paenibacillus provencensis TaxID=441151 RepID=A0ABW3Q9T8_9BACL|nr:ATP-binding protein [Paenibacillus sp. MER 78]SFS36999.1 Signal transduction histidine kinase [Paenibacillus sp. 453mf]
MLIHRLKLIFFPISCMLIIIASSILGQNAHRLCAMIVVSILLLLSVALDHKYPRFLWVQLILLGIFQYITQLNWCVLLYYIMIMTIFDKKQSYKKTLPVSVLLILQYTIIRLSYVPISAYNILVTIFDFLTLIFIVFLFHYVIRAETEKQLLRDKNDYLTTHDPLTGLLNYLGYMNQIQALISKKVPFYLILLDLQNFKSFNHDGLESGNEALINLGQALTSTFPNAYGVSRYAGDRYALLLPTEYYMPDHIGALLEMDTIGYQVSYSIVTHPEESADHNQLIMKAEDKLFQIRREQWLQREEDLFRSEKMKVVGELAAGMAHEVRNPLTAIRGFVQLSKIQSYNIKPWYEVIMNEITRVTELTAEFLQFSKPHASNMRSESLTVCIERVISLSESDATSRGHQLTLEIEDDAMYIYMDRDKIVQVLLNLVRNALEAMEIPGEVKIHVSRADSKAVIQIQDTGTGIAPDQLHQIFNPFYTTKEDGTGLGLSLCQKISQDHKGSITVHSVLGEGSTFQLILPVLLDGNEVADPDHLLQ